jgi:hypothetical protein
MWQAGAADPLTMAPPVGHPRPPAGRFPLALTPGGGRLKPANRLPAQEESGSSVYLVGPAPPSTETFPMSADAPAPRLPEVIRTPHAAPAPWLWGVYTADDRVFLGAPRAAVATHEEFARSCGLEGQAWAAFHLVEGEDHVDLFTGPGGARPGLNPGQLAAATVALEVALGKKVVWRRRSSLPAHVACA